MILVVGATSRVGTRLIPMLLAKGYKVRAMTRTPEKAEALRKLGAEVVQGDLRQPATLVRACQGVEQVLDAAQGFIPGTPDNDIHIVDDVGNRSLIDAARAAGVNHFVFISIDGAAPDSPMEFFRIKYAAEEFLKASGMSYTILRCTAFMEFWGAMVGEPVLKTGKTTIFGRGNNPVNFVSAEDVAKFSLIALEDLTLRDQMLKVGGPENLTLNQVAAIFEKISGKPAQKSHIPLPMMRVMRVLMRLINPAMSGQITGGILMDTTDQSLDMTQTLRKYPLELKCLEDVAREIAAQK